MAKGAKKKSNGVEQVQLPNHWVKIGSFIPGSTCTECGAAHVRGMRWMQGSINACRPCGQKIARRSTGLAA